MRAWTRTAAERRKGLKEVREIERLITMIAETKGKGEVVWGDQGQLVLKGQFAKTSAPYYPTILCWLVCSIVSAINQTLRKYAQSVAKQGPYPTTSRNCSCCLQSNRPLTQQPQLLTRCHKPITEWFLHQSGSTPNHFKERLPQLEFP